MIPTWLEHAAAFLGLWLALACIAAPLIGAWLKRRAPIPPAPGDPCPPDEVPVPGPDAEAKP
jgi:hypothetical protein